MFWRFEELLRKFVLILAATYFSPELVNADVINFKSVQFNGEYNGGPNSWSQLSFTIDRPKVGQFSYATRSKVSFTIDTDVNSKFLRTDIRFRGDWLTSRWFSSTSKTEMYLGSNPLNTAQRRDLSSLLQNEKKLAAWIVANADELIDFALTSGRYLPAKSRTKWNSLSRNDTFEKNIRKNLGPHLRAELAAYDKHAKHTKVILERRIQPDLKKLGYYNGKVDGLWGSQTKAAIMAFERDNDLFPDGVNYGSERFLLQDKVKENDQYSDIAKIKQREANDQKTIKELTRRLSSANTEAAKLKQTAQLRQEAINRLYGQIAELKKAANVTEDIAKLEQELTQAKTVAKRHSSIAAERLKIIKNYQSEISKLKKENSSSNDISRLQKDLELANKLASDRFKTILGLNKKVSELKRKVVSSAEIDALKNELSIALSQLSVFEDESEELSTQLTKLNADREKAFEKLSLITKARDNLELQLADALSSNETLTLRAENLEKEKQKLIKELENIKSQIDSTDFLPVFQLSEEWLEVERFLAVQQVRFCQILSNYSVEAKAAAESKNQLRQNLVATNRDNDIAALLPNGNYNDWVVKVVEIYATPSGDAAFVLRLPCDVTFGSGQLNGAGDLDGSYAATAEFGGIIYNQLAQLSQGDTVLISGKILTYDDIGALNQRLKFITNLNGENALKTEPRKNRAAPDYFSKIDYLSKL